MGSFFSGEIAWVASFASLGLGGLHGAGLGARLLHGAIAGVIGGPLGIGLGGILGLDLGPYSMAWRVLSLASWQNHEAETLGRFHPLVY